MIYQQFVMWVKVAAADNPKLSDRELFRKLRADIQKTAGLPAENLIVSSQPDLSGFTALVNVDEEKDPSAKIVEAIRRYFRGVEIEIRSGGKTSAIALDAQLRAA